MSNPLPVVPVTHALWGVIRFLGRHRAGVIGAVLLLSLNIGIELSLPQFLGNAITALADPQSGTAGAERLRRDVLIFAGLVLLRTVVGLVLGPLRNRTAQRTLGDIRAAVYDALQRQSFTWHDNARTGELISRASTDVARLQEFMFVCLFFSVDLVVGILGTTLLMFALNTVLGIVTLSVLVPTMFALAYFARRLQPRWRQVHDRHAEMSTVLQENIAGVRVVKAFARESSEVAKFREKRDRYLRDLENAVNEWAARVPLAQFLFGLGVPLVLWMGGRQVIAGDLPLGDLAKAVFYLLGLSGRIVVIGQVTNVVQLAGSAAQRIHEILRAPMSLPDGRRAVDEGPGELVFEHVSFEYRREPSLQVLREEAADPGTSTDSGAVRESSGAKPWVALADLSFTARGGRTLAVVGATGSGKSTLLSLIPRFYDPTAGRVLLDGVDLREFRVGELRQAVGVVFQETFLFSATVADNIAFGRPGADLKSIEDAARVARAHDFIEALPKGYQTVIGERGISLSGGQRQRIAIARALLGRPKVILLDDATSAIDPATEREIREALAELCRGRTTFVVAHRAATVRLSDEILVLREGRLLARGGHGELMETCAHYRELFHGQLSVGDTEFQARDS